MKAIAVVGLFSAVCSVSILMAQEAPMFSTPQQEHAWLQQFVGEWNMESEASALPGQPATKCQGTFSSRTLGGFWIVSEMNSVTMGQPVTAVQTIGYDPESEKYIGTWVDSMMNHLWKYEGTVDSTGKILTLEAEGPNFTLPGQVAKYRDVYEFKTQDHIAMSSSVRGEDGKWATFATGNLHRAK